MANVIPLIPATVYNATMGPILSEIQRHLLEPTIDEGNTWQLWNRNEVINYFRERLSRFLVETLMVTSRVTLPAKAGENTIDLPSTLAELLRVEVGGTGLVPIDYWTADSGILGWEDDTGTPYAYFQDPLAPLTIRLFPTPSSAMNVLCHYISSTPLDAPAEAEAAENLDNYYLRIPAIFSWAIKYGVMADMLNKEGEANDPERGTYCEQRFREGVELAKLMIGVKGVGGGK